MVSSLLLSLSCWNPQSHLRVKSRVFSSSESSSSSSSSQKTNNTAQTRFAFGARGRSCTNDTSPFFLSALRVMQKQTYLTFPKCVLFKRTHAESREPLPSLSRACTHSLFSLSLFFSLSLGRFRIRLYRASCSRNVVFIICFNFNETVVKKRQFLLLGKKQISLFD